MMEYLLVSWERIPGFRVDNDTISIVPAIAKSDVDCDNEHLELPTTVNEAEGGASSSVTEKNRVNFIKFSAKREKLMYILTHDVLVREERCRRIAQQWNFFVDSSM